MELNPLGKKEEEGHRVLVRSFSNSAYSEEEKAVRCQLSAPLHWVQDVLEDGVDLVVPATVRGVRGRGRGKMKPEEAKG